MVDLRQRDPLSPMLFLLVVDVLNRMLTTSVASGDLSDPQLKGELNSIRSLQFTDDTIIFSKASSSDMITLKIILLISVNISGLKPLTKSEETSSGVAVTIFPKLSVLFPGTQNNFISRVIFSLYSKDGSNLVLCLPKSLASKLLKDLHSINSDFFSFARWQVGDGKSCRFWIDKWAGVNSLSSLFPKAFNLAFSPNCNSHSQGFMVDNFWNWHIILRRGSTTVERSDIASLRSFLDTLSSVDSHSKDYLWWPLHLSGTEEDRMARRIRRAASSWSSRKSQRRKM
ncbi:uncharacterized protein LOC109842239 [Asparagus officinalis]|uniref:uncharacterized protein LOC109842239 n=1 Tax=Asparagus officinalis TaxID=4686 RepID=UPI00098E237C|nr:uncharacterized protein LOC109842239 [Asparagus officinalis]